MRVRGVAINPSKKDNFHQALGEEPRNLKQDCNNLKLKDGSTEFQEFYIKVLDTVPVLHS